MLQSHQQPGTLAAVLLPRCAAVLLHLYILACLLVVPDCFSGYRLCYDLEEHDKVQAVFRGDEVGGCTKLDDDGNSGDV